MKTRLANLVLGSPVRLPILIGVYAGLAMTGASVRDAVTSPAAQVEAVLALRERFDTPFMLTAMDLSAEAQAFGCAVRLCDEDIPTVIGRRVTSLEELVALPQPHPGDARTAVHLEAARQLALARGSAQILGGLIGPFSLAGRLFGVSEALEATASAPELLHTLLERCARFLTEYALAFKAAGADGVIMAEPAAGLLSPRALAQFSARYVRRIVEIAQDENFAIILHNCSARLPHLSRILESGAEIYHFGAPMDLPAALAQMDGQAVLAGNLDPTAVFHVGTVAEVRQKTRALLSATSRHPGFIPSSGCDLPPGTPVENLAAFYCTIQESLT